VKNIAPTNGVVEVRFKGLPYAEGDSTQRGQAFLQALAIGNNLRGKSARPVSSNLKPPGNLLLNSGFEETISGAKGAPKTRDTRAEWISLFGGRSSGYVYQESEYRIHPDWGLPEFHSGEGAIRTHFDSDGQTTIYQDVEVKPGTTYRASVWVRAVDLHGKGFGKAEDDSAGLMLREMNAVDKVLHTHPKVEVKKAGPYTLLSQTITTGPDTVKVRFALETTIKCHYTVGHVTYDDCFFGSATTDSTSR
jgi:hypothetical protein